MYLLEELSIEVTNECTLACKHCSSGSTPKKLNNELTFIEHSELVEQARLLGATVLSLSGGNPLLYSPLTKLIDQATDLGYERILIYTTGHSHVGRLVGDWPGIHRVMSNPKVTWIFSLHTTDTLINDWIMGEEGTTVDVMASIEYLRMLGQRVEIHMVPMQPNYRHISKVRLWCEEMGIDKLSLLRFVPQTRGRLNAGTLGMTKADFIQMQLIIHQEVQNYEAGVTSTQIRLGCPIDFRHALGLIPEKVKPCHAGDDLILVRPTGDVHPCAAWKSLPSDSNVRHDKLSYIWNNSETYKKIREFKRIGFLELSGKHGCTDCRNRNSCMTGCLAQRLHVNGSKSLDDLWTGAGDPLCPGLSEE